MKKLKIFIAIAAFVILSLPDAATARSYRTKSSDVYVRGYTTKNGTYVAPHYRSAPDNSIHNNYSCLDNGRCGGSSYIFTPSNAYKIPSYITPTYIAPTYAYRQPTPTCSSNAYWDGTQCSCIYGYVKGTKTEACLTLNESCKERYGSSAIYRESDGLCHYCTMVGYRFDNGSGKCINNPTTMSNDVPKDYVGIKLDPVSGHNVQYFPDGSALDLVTHQIIR